MDPITTFRGKSVALNIPNIDTDQVTPANYTKVTDKLGLGKILFAHWRYKTPSFEPNPDFPLNKPGAQGATILVSGDNFGCGSSREHAPWALYDYGFRALISPSYADIFNNNCYKNGLLPIVLPQAAVQSLLDAALAQPGAHAIVDLEAQSVTAPDGSTHRFDIDPRSKHCLLQGIDEIDYTLSQLPLIEAYERRKMGSGSIFR
ncbi:MAG TPA: 3-isopropylmalate dehydratase small subunit [Planctomycetota bacterium]|nr:3-isopropylmalate dehydratase small subunit [Planctomycetota bacterium]